MTFQPGAAVYTQGFGTAPSGPNYPVYVAAAPTSATVNGPSGVFQVGQLLVQPGVGIWHLLQLTSSGGSLAATWVQVANATGDILAVLGTANQITSTTSAGTATLSLPSAITTPGSLTTTTTLTAGSSLAVTTSATVGTSLGVGTTITATLGNITATNGNVVLGTAGNKILSTSVGTTTSAGANSFGSVALSSGAATVATTAVTANSLIFLTCQALGSVSVASGLTVTAKTASTSFVITASQGTDTSTIAWFIVN